MWIEIGPNPDRVRGRIVTSLAEVWIEITCVKLEDLEQRVTSLAEVWIEIV